MTDCNRYVYIDGEFAYRTDDEGVEYIKGCVQAHVGPKEAAERVEVRDTYHRSNSFPLGATGAWIKQAAERYGPIITVG